MARSRKQNVELSKAPGAFAEQIDGFIHFVDLERGLSTHTQSGYQSDLDQCAHFLSQEGASDWRSVDPGLVEKWIHSLSRRFSTASLARKLTALRVFSRYLVREDLRADDFTELLSGPKLTRRIPGTLTSAEVDRLLAAPSGGEPMALRDRAILELF